MIRSLLSNIVNYVLPHRCSSCASLTEQTNGICAKCFHRLNFITNPYCNICGFPFEFSIEGQNSCAKCVSSPPKYDISRSLLKFDQSSKHLIHAFKYNDKTTHAKMFARLMIARYKSELLDVDLVVPVPMHRWKRVFRNYNPAQVLAGELAKLLGKPMIPDLLVKKRWTRSQTGLSKEGRSRNLSGSIVIGKSDELKGKIILLVDDVKTTGATGNLCSSILKKSGASCVIFIAISMT